MLSFPKCLLHTLTHHKGQDCIFISPPNPNPKPEPLRIWEVWARDSYNRSECMVVDTDGAVLQSETPMAYPFPLPFADDVPHLLVQYTIVASILLSIARI